MQKNKKNKWFTVITLLVMLGFFSLLFSSCASILLISEDIDTGNVAHIAINGIIQPGTTQDLFSDTLSSTSVVGDLKRADKDRSIRAVLLEINSPGGTPVASYEIQEAVGQLNKTSVCWIREMGASGAYWVASACDIIVANPISIVGSVGVLGSYLDFSGLMDDYNVTYQRLTGGKYKDIGSSLRPLSDEERDMLQDLIDQMHGMFLESVAKNRGLEKDQIDEISTGMFFLGTKGKDLGLVDVLGGKTEAISIIEKEINQTAELVQYRKDVTFLDILSSLMAEYSYKLGMRSMISADNKISLR